MPSDSTTRRRIKRVARGALGDRGYGWLQAAAMARDIRAGAVREPELDLLCATRSGDTVIDVGANYGFWSVPMARAVGDAGRVLAFEPVPFTVVTLHRVLRLLRVHNVAVHAAACGDQAGELELRVPVQPSGAISAGQAHSVDRDDERAGWEAHVRWADSTTVTAPVIRLDDVVPSSMPVSLLKCDVEGTELHVIRGAEAILRRHRPIIVAEINPWFLEGLGLQVDDLTGYLAEIGYALHRYDARTRQLVPVVEDVEEANYVFVHPDSHERLGSLLPR